MTRPTRVLLLVVACAGSLAGQSSVQPSALRVAGLTCEYSTDPMGIDVAAPRLSWRLESGQRAQRQTAWQVLVAASREALDRDEGGRWDSGKVASDATNVRYAGSPMASSRPYFWKVRAWNGDDRPTAWSAVATWTTGLMTRDEWRATWIAAPGASETLLARRDFEVLPDLKRAIVHVSGLGQYELFLNGTRVGRDLFAPGWTDYDKTILYDTFDVTDHIADGRNAVALVLGNGMYNVVRRNRFAKFTGSYGPLRAILRLQLEYDSGLVDAVVTDDHWRTHPGPETFAGIYGGEDYDARLVPPGWDRVGFDDRRWARAVPVLLTTGQLVGHSAGFEPVREIEVRQPVARREVAPRVFVYDFGQNASFYPRIRVSGGAGTRVRLTPAEVVNPDGTIFRGTMGGPHRGSSWWQYTKATDQPETWTPRFYYLGSRYLQVEELGDGEGAQPPAVLDAIDAVVVHSSATPVGTFSSSSEVLNRIHEMVRWSQRSNMVSVITDCPHREKLGWIEQLHLNGPSLRYAFDLNRSFEKAMRDMTDAQTTDGLVPNVAPEYVEFEGPFRNAAEWGAAFILVPWQQYLFTGDDTLLRRHYDAMVRYFAFLESRAKDDILSDGLGDWYDFDLAIKGRANLTPPAFTATAFYHEDARVLSKIAGLLGPVEDERRFRAKAERIRQRFVREFYNHATGDYGTGSQAANAMALALGLAEPAHRERVLSALVRDVESRGYASAGDVGFGYLLRALAANGRSDLVLRLVLQDDKPGYAYQLRNGATTLAEAWDGNLGVSQNHIILGQIVEWLYRDLAGIGLDEARPGFAHVDVRPTALHGLTWVSASYASIRGQIAVRWERDGTAMRVAVTLPPNTTGTVHLPLPPQAAIITESGRPVARVPGVSLVRLEPGRAVLEIPSGRYDFEAR